MAALRFVAVTIVVSVLAGVPIGSVLQGRAGAAVAGVLALLAGVGVAILVERAAGGSRAGGSRAGTVRGVEAVPWADAPAAPAIAAPVGTPSPAPAEERARTSIAPARVTGSARGLAIAGVALILVMGAGVLVASGGAASGAPVGRAARVTNAPGAVLVATPRPTEWWGRMPPTPRPEPSCSDAERATHDELMAKATAWEKERTPGDTFVMNPYYYPDPEISLLCYTLLASEKP